MVFPLALEKDKHHSGHAEGRTYDKKKACQEWQSTNMSAVCPCRKRKMAEREHMRKVWHRMSISNMIAG
jgi:hypothetical protein